MKTVLGKLKWSHFEKFFKTIEFFAVVVTMIFVSVQVKEISNNLKLTSSELINDHYKTLFQSEYMMLASALQNNQTVLKENGG